MTDVQVPPPRYPVPRAEQPEAVAVGARPAVLVVGPRADARGGIGSVQFVLEQHASALADLEVVTTHRDGPVRARLWAMAGGTARAGRRIVVARPAWRTCTSRSARRCCARACSGCWPGPAAGRW